MDKKQSIEAFELLREIGFVDKEKFELRKEIQHKGCPFCEVDDGEFIENYQTKQALFYGFKKCNICSLVYPHPRPNKAVFGGYFTKNETSISSEEQFKACDTRDKMREVRKNTSSFVMEIIRNIWRRSPMCYSYQEFEKYAKKGYKVLDIGSGHGLVAKKLMEKGCNVEAVEINPYRAKYLREKVGIKTYETAFEEIDLKPESYDMIILSQVLMHIFSIRKTMNKIKLFLRPGGLIVSSQMNFNSIAQKTLRAPYPGNMGLTAFSISSWFTPESLKKILEKSGFEVKCIKFRPNNLLESLFVDGYPGGIISRLCLKAMDQIIKIIVMRTGTSDYFSIIAKKVK